MSEAAAIELERLLLEGTSSDEWQSRHLMSAEVTPFMALEALKLLCPELVAYRGGWFRKDAFTEETADAFIAKAEGGAGLAAAEYVINHLHLDAYLLGQTDPEPATARALGEAIAYGWRNWARDRYGLTVHTHVDEGSFGYEVWFYSSAELSAFLDAKK